MVQVLPALKHVYAYDLDEVLAQLYAEEMSADLGIVVEAVSDLSRAAKASQCIVTCTPAREAFLLKEHVMSGTFVAAVGADSPEKQEIEPDLMAGTKVVADVLEQCVHVGEIHHAIEAGLIKEEDVHAELGEVITGKKTGRTADDEIIIYDATGTALQDAAAAAAAYKRAVEKGLGVSLALFE
jgi:ornithine cyclodeaminase/alanine dehydrogenase